MICSLGRERFSAPAFGFGFLCDTTQALWVLSVLGGCVSSGGGFFPGVLLQGASSPWLSRSAHFSGSLCNQTPAPGSAEQRGFGYRITGQFDIQILTWPPWSICLVAVYCLASALCLGSRYCFLSSNSCLEWINFLFIIFLSLGLSAIPEFARKPKTLLRTLGSGRKQSVIWGFLLTIRPVWIFPKSLRALLNRAQWLRHNNDQQPTAAATIYYGASMFPKWYRQGKKGDFACSI